MPKQTRSAKRFTTGIISANTATKLITAKNRRKTRNELIARDVSFRDLHRKAGTSPPGRSGDHRYLLRLSARDWVLSEKVRHNRRRLLPRGTRNDRLGRGSRVRVGKPGFAGTPWLGRLCISIRDYGCALVLDRCDPRDGVSRPGDDAVLLHLENALGSGISKTSLWHRGRRLERDHFRGDD